MDEFEDFLRDNPDKILKLLGEDLVMDWVMNNVTMRDYDYKLITDKDEREI